MAERMAREWSKRGIAVLMRRGLWVEPRGAAEITLLTVGYLKNMRSCEDFDKQPQFCKYARRIWYSIVSLLTWRDGAALARCDLEVLDGAAAARASSLPERSTTTDEVHRDEHDGIGSSAGDLGDDDPRGAQLRDPQRAQPSARHPARRAGRAA